MNALNTVPIRTRTLLGCHDTTAALDVEVVGALLVPDPLPVEEGTGKVEVMTADVDEGVTLAVPTSTV